MKSTFFYETTFEQLIKKNLNINSWILGVDQQGDGQFKIISETMIFGLHLIYVRPSFFFMI